MLQSRRLAAIMFTDIVGYTAMMQEDEALTLNLRDKVKNKLETEVALHGGKIVKFSGDGALCSFGSAIESIQVAIAVQLHMLQEPKVPLRIGIHEADIVFEDGDVLGDGVNIASRLESLAIPGSILISAKVYDDIKNQKNIQVSSLGKYLLKNVTEPMEIFSISNPGLEVPFNKKLEGKGIKYVSDKVTFKKKALLVSTILVVLAVIFMTLILTDLIKGGKSVKVGEIKSLIVLPFLNYSGQDTLDWFVAGMHASLIQDIGKIGSLRVLGTTTSKVFKDSDKTINEITSEAGVDAALETNVLCLGKDSICCQARLIKHGQEEEQLWSADYKIARTQILNWYNGITKEIAKEINVELTDRENKLLEGSITMDKEVYDYYFKGLYYTEDADKESLMKAMEYLNRAVEKNPDWAHLYNGLTLVWASLVQMGFESSEIAGPKIFENLNKALELDPDNSDSRFLSGLMAFLAEWDWEKSEKELLKALAINPSNAMARVIYAQLLGSLQRPDEALIQANMGIDLDPRNPSLRIQYAAALLCVGDCRNALIQAEKITADDPEHFLANNIIENGAILCGDYDKVMKAAKYILPVRGIDYQKVERVFEEQGFVPAYEEVMRQSEVLAQKGYFSPFEMGIRYRWVNQPDKAMEWFEKGFELHDPNMVYINTSFNSRDPLFSNPRFIAIVEKMNLPLPKN